MKLVTVLFAVVLLAAFSGCLDTQAQKDQLRLDKRLDRFYEEEWIKCVNELGMDRCLLIQETGFRHCDDYDASTPNHQRHGIEECVKARYEDRAALLPPEYPRAAPDPLKPEKEEPVPAKEAFP